MIDATEFKIAPETVVRAFCHTNSSSIPLIRLKHDDSIQLWTADGVEIKPNDDDSITVPKEWFVTLMKALIPKP